MAAQLNHTIVNVRDKEESALSEMLGLGDPVPFSPFQVVEADNEVSLDFMDARGEVRPSTTPF